MSKLETSVERIGDFNGWKGEELVKRLGASYVPGRDVKEIAKDVRGIIRKAIKAGYLPQLKASVTIERYSMGQSINVVIKEIDETVINVDAWRVQAANGYNLSWADHGGMYNDRGKFILGFIRRVLSAFNKSDYHAQSDYHNTAFYGDVNFHGDVERGQFAALAEAD